MERVSTIRSLVVCSLCCALTCILAMFKIPIGVVPITLANLAVYVSGALLGPVYGLISQFLYLALVFVGFPFTSGFSGGPSYFVRPTAGYMIGYLPMVFVLGYIYKTFSRKTKRYENKMVWLFVGAVFGTIICYFFGTAWYVNQSKTDFFKALNVCVYPFLIGDFLKILIATMVVPKIERVLEL